MAIDSAYSMLEITTPTSDLHNLTSVTFMAWVNIDAANLLAGFMGIHVAGVASYRKSLGIYVDAGTPYIAAFIMYDGGQSATATAPAPSFQEWHHVCGRWSQSVNSGKAEILIDGVDATVSSVTPTGNPVNDGGAVTFLAVQAFATFSMDGKLTDAAIFDRRLGDDEVLAVAAGGLRATYLGPVLHMTLEGTTGTAAIGDVGLRDTTGRGNHVDSITNAPGYYRDPPLHWPVGPILIPSGGRMTLNSRPTMNVVPGTKLATMRRAC